MKKVLIGIHEELYQEFKKDCDKNFITLSEKIRNLILSYLKMCDYNEKTDNKTIPTKVKIIPVTCCLFKRSLNTK